MWKVTDKGVIIPIKISPKAAKNAIVGWENGELKIRIAAIPEKGNANEELIHFLAKEFNVSKQQISIISGKTSRHKRISIEGWDMQKVTSYLKWQA